MHFGKRMNIQNKQTNKELFYDQCAQIQLKNMQKVQEKANLKKQEYIEMLQLKEEAIRDDIEREIDHKNKQADFKREMDQMQEHKKLKAQIDLQTKFNETYDYFPFTHGENIDNMKENYKKIVLSSMRQQNTSQSSISSSVNRGKSTTQTLFNRTGLHNPVTNDYMITDPKMRKFRSIERHPEVIKSALERFENTLLQREQEKMQDMYDFKCQVEHNKQYETMLKEKVLNEQRLNRENLMRHMLENRKKSQQEHQEKLKYIRTNYGPEETDFTYIRQTQKQEKDKEMLKQELYKQVKIKKDQDISKVLEKIEDQKNLKINQDILDAIRREEKDAKDTNITENVKMWDLQARLKSQA